MSTESQVRCENETQKEIRYRKQSRGTIPGTGLKKALHNEMQDRATRRFFVWKKRL